MNTITQENFQKSYPEIEKTLKNASVIAIDAEFSGLDSSNADSSEQSLFDSSKERYRILRKNIDPFIAIQVGITAFTREKHQNKYSCKSYDFHLLPRPLPTKNRMFLTQAAAIEFLSAYKFDFNQFAYNAISYLDEEDESKLRKALKNKNLLWEANDFVSIGERDEVDECLETVHKWLKDSGETVLRMKASSYPIRYLMQKELRQNFKDIWTESLESTEFSVIAVTKDVRESLEEQDSLDEELIDHFMGFSKVFQLLTHLKKPIVGHNLYLDLMFMHKQFYRPLPGNYETFKSNIHRLFPRVYDTKFLSFEMRKVLNRATWKSNVLSELYEFCKDGPGRCLAMNSPVIEGWDKSNATEKNVEKYHDAGWDSYCTGYCFIRIAHMFAARKLSKEADLRQLTNTEILSGVQDKVNRVNLIRADLSHLRLDGPDPESTRPRWLHVRAFTDDFSTRQIARALSRFGIVDVKRHSARGVLVAVPNHKAAKDILTSYEGNKEFRVVPYHPLRHSPNAIKVFVWVGGLFLSGAGVCAWILGRGNLSQQ